MNKYTLHHLQFTFVLLLIVTGVTAQVSAEETSSMDAKAVTQFLKTHCYDCHGVKKQSSDRRFDTLATEFKTIEQIDHWQDILDQINLGEMPPKKRPQPKAEETKAVVQWITAQLKTSVRPADDYSPKLRRLNRREYENTIRDLMKINVTFGPARAFPEDDTAYGFDNVGNALVFSPAMMREAVTAAEDIVNRSVDFRSEKPESKVHKILPKQAASPVYRDEHHVKIVTGTENGFQQFRPTSKNFPILERGDYLIRVHATGMHSDFQGVGSTGGPVKMSIRVGPSGKGGNITGRRIIQQYDMPDDSPQTYEVRARFDEGHIPIVSFPNGHDGSYKNLIRKRYSKEARNTRKSITPTYDGPQLQVFWIEVEGPLHGIWPPVSHANLFGSLPTDKNREYAKLVITRFCAKAFRRRITDQDASPFVALFDQMQAAGEDFEYSIQSSFQAVLSSPKFLYHRWNSETPDDFDIANRLSYFLWSTMPDEQLIMLAEQQKLHDPEILNQQIERMLDDPKSDQFVQHFSNQWLGISELGKMPPDPKRFKNYYDNNLEQAMREETRLFFVDILENNRSVANFIDSDFTYLNEPLAQHYGITGVEGNQFRRVLLTQDQQRGGILGHASVLTVTSNGTVTSPVIRGIWILENLLGNPPPPPPPDVEPIDPDIRGATTIREQLAKHREIETCAACHSKIDPLGFALENFDPTGALRVKYDNKLPIDASGELANGATFNGASELKMLLMTKEESVVRCITEKLLIYATGKEPSRSDRQEVDQIVKKSMATGSGLRDLIKLIVTSKPFLQQ
ncbi:MAG: hypothetical protein COA78_35550 [Blastopirellula sp.]|nr:MAG: hypothetical protein COA78_35550 [Blastopirellula sp.]